MKQVQAIAVMVVAAMAATTIILVWRYKNYDFPTERKAIGQPTTNTSSAPSTAPPRSNINSQNRPRHMKEVGQADYAAALHHSDNYLVYVRSTIVAAKAGDTDAQYNLGKALSLCETAYRSYFRRNGRPLSVDEAFQYAATLNRPSGIIRSLYSRCHELANEPEGEFGSAMDWIAKAAVGGVPAAQSEIALMTLMQKGITAGSGGLDSAPTLLAPSNMDQDPFSLLLAAVESKDPQALWDAGLAQGFVTQDYDDKVVNQLAWWLVSCQRGLDCGADAEWIQLNCADVNVCPSGTRGVEYIQAIASDSWQKVEERAFEINAKLDANRWSELDLGG